MKSRIFLRKKLLIGLFIFSNTFLFGQKDSTVRLIVSVRKNNVGQPAIPYSDTLKIKFDLGFADDIVLIKSNDDVFETSPLKTDLLFGHAGTLNIPKAKRKQQLSIYLNNTFIGTLILKKKFSAVHIDHLENQIRWTYINYRFFYL